MEKEQLPRSIPSEEKEYPFGESKEMEHGTERAMKEVAALFGNKLHPETLRYLASQFAEIHKRFATLIEFGEATLQDEKEFIEAANGWRDPQKGAFPLEEWRAKLAHVTLPEKEYPH